MKLLELVAMALVVVVGILSECVIAFVNPFVSPLRILCGLFPPSPPHNLLITQRVVVSVDCRWETISADFVD